MKLKTLEVAALILLFRFQVSALEVKAPPVNSQAIAPASGCFGPSCILNTNSVLTSSGSLVVQSTTSTTGHKVLDVRNYSGSSLLNVTQGGNGVMAGTLTAGTLISTGSVVGASANISGSGVFTGNIDTTGGNYLYGSSRGCGLSGTQLYCDRGGSFFTGYGFNTGATSGLFIDSSGRIGVGMTTPCSTCTVHVNGGVSVIGNLNITGTTSPTLVSSATMNMLATAITGTIMGPCVTGSTITFVSSGTAVEIGFTIAVEQSLDDGYKATLGILVDGNYPAGFSNVVGMWSQPIRYQNQPVTASVNWILPSTAGSHTYCLTGATQSASTLTVPANAGTFIPQAVFYVKDLR